MQQATDDFNKREFWIHENLLYAQPNFRLEKCARLINGLMQGRTYDLLDVGCGPAALRRLLDSSITYHGVDIAIHEPAPYLRELDIVQNPIAFEAKHFDVVVALGVFEYMGKQQDRKFGEIREILNADGRFIMSYINFRHYRRRIWPAYNNIQPIGDLLQSLAKVFRVERCFPVSHHWRHKQPGRNALPAVQMHLNWNIPLVSPWLAVEYFCVCTRRN